MRKWTAALLLLGPGLIGLGCSMARTTAHNLVVMPAHFPMNWEHCLLCVHSRKLADRVWVEVHAAEGWEPVSEAYADGFRDGFSDYVIAGGNAEPPPLPPRQYWKRPPQASTDWFAGFRHGAGVAKQGGYRDGVVVPISGPPPPEGPPPPGELEMLPPAIGPTVPAPTAPAKETLPELPPPRPLKGP